MQQKCVYFDGLQTHYEVNIHQSLNILLVKPNFGISTAEVFKLYREQIKTSELKPIVQKDKILEYILDGDNQLYDIAQKIQPKIIDVISELKKQKGIITARMSGSGSTCFGIFDDEVLLKNAKDNIFKTYPEWFLHDCTQDFSTK
jgi:4-diphosphocytidyl-2-C-methyl-D-erythritol kinase